MTRAAFDALMESASKTTQSAGKKAIQDSYDDQDNCRASRTKSKCCPRDEQIPAAENEVRHSGIVFVRITSYRQRLLDIDNLMPKWHLDCCRYAKLIRDDNPAAIEFTCAQIKVAKKTEQRTEIEITYP